MGKDDDWLERASWITKRKRGRPPRAGTAANKRFTVRLTDEEYKRWRKAAVGQTFNDWVRKACNKALEEDL